MAWALRLAAGTLTLSDAFSFMSGLYFRGKIGYARAFGWRPSPALVITPTRGLLSPDTFVTADLLHEFAAVDVHADDTRYRTPLERTLGTVAETTPADARFVLLGSIATGKYVDVLTDALGDRLFYPADFIGRGDMSRGGLMLRAAASGVELEYRVLRRDVPRRGTRPPRLTPLRA